MADKNRKIAVMTSCILLTIFAVLTFVYYGVTAFSSDGVMQVVVPFSGMIGWITTRWFSLQSIAGLCYLLSLIVSVLLIAIAVVFFIGDKVIKKKIVERILKILLIGFSVFYFFAFVINIATVITQEGAVFYAYLITELLKLLALVFIFVIYNFQTKKEESKNEKVQG